MSILDIVSRRSVAGADRILDRDACAALTERVLGMARGGGHTSIMILSRWSGELRWARNRASLASDRTDTDVFVLRSIRGAEAIVITNQLDDASLGAAVRAAERLAHYRPASMMPEHERPPTLELSSPKIWSAATYDLSAEDRASAAGALTGPAESAGMLSAGYIEARARGVAMATDTAGFSYAPYTLAQCSMTVRDPKGTGSGWAGLSSYDWSRIDGPKLAQRALDKCLASRSPVALEPGRYTVILEPQAVADLVTFLFEALDDAGQGRVNAEQGRGPFAAGFDNTRRDVFGSTLGLSRIGQKIMDERITITQDPMDPELGVVPFSTNGEPIRPVSWIAHGALQEIAHARGYSLASFPNDFGVPFGGGFRMSGGPTSVDEMIRTTQRGLLVTRLSNNRLIDPATLLCTGLTRDGLWLIENGRISKPVKNFRFTESPLFVLNSVEQLGEPMPVFSAPPADDSARFLTPAIVPPLKARDFSFTSTADAI